MPSSMTDLKEAMYNTAILTMSNYRHKFQKRDTVAHKMEKENTLCGQVSTYNENICRGTNTWNNYGTGRQVIVFFSCSEYQHIKK